MKERGMFKTAKDIKDAEKKTQSYQRGKKTRRILRSQFSTKKAARVSLGGSVN